MKYIDVVRLKAEIEKNTPNHLMLMVYRDHILALIDSLQQEQPSLPDLDKAAREIVIKMHPSLIDCTILGDRLTRGQLMALVKAGAEWVMQQLKGE